MAEKTCLNCALAKWDRTATGRLHPSGNGRCLWVMDKIAIPRAFYWLSSSQDYFPWPSGGWINRRKPHTDCPLWTAKEKE